MSAVDQSDRGPIARERIDDALKDWRQGDAVLGDGEFMHLADLSAPLTPAASEMAGQTEGVGAGPALAIVATKTFGRVILSQSCDVVRSCDEIPFVEVAPLVEVDAATLELARLGRLVSYAYVPGVADRRLVAHLDRTMTVEKAVVARWSRTPGCRDDREARNFAAALARKRARPAFPDDFVELVDKLTRRIKDKHSRSSDEGRMLSALREIRVRAAPSWSAAEVTLTFVFIKSDGSDPVSPEKWAEQLERCNNLVTPAGRFVDVDSIVTTLDDMTGRDLVESDALDLDHLSQPKSP